MGTFGEITLDKNISRYCPFKLLFDQNNIEYTKRAYLFVPGRVMGARTGTGGGRMIPMGRGGGAVAKIGAAATRTVGAAAAGVTTGGGGGNLPTWLSEGARTPSMVSSPVARECWR